MASQDISEAPIGIFDSGVGGLTVLRAIKEALPNEHLLYLGDTARLPYGTKSAQTVNEYALKAAQKLVDRGIKCLVVACNTASSVALETLTKAFDPIPVVGVLLPGAKASCQASKTGHIAILATESTVKFGKYQQAIMHLRPDAVVHQWPCSLFVALAEEGWAKGPLVESIIQHALDPYLNALAQLPDCILLGCTHFPIFQSTMEKLFKDQAQIVDSAHSTAKRVVELLEDNHLLNTSQIPNRVQFLATDGIDRFSKVAKLFLNTQIDLGQIQLVSL